jgi:hypothetical protein
VKKITVDEVVKAYIETRDEIETKKKAYEEEEQRLKKMQATREDWLKEEAKKSGVEGFKTLYGSTYPLIKESVKMADWDRFVEDLLVKPVVDKIMETWGFEEAERLELETVVKEGAKLEFLNHVANKTACLEVMGERDKKKGRPNSPPAGVSYEAFETVGVRRS